MRANDVMTRSRVEHNEELAQILAYAPDAIVSIDAQGRIETFSPAAERIFGWSALEAVGRNVSFLMPEPYRSRHDGYLAAHHAGKPGGIIGIGPREIRAVRKDGSEFAAELAVGKIASDGDTPRFIGLIRDITVRKQAEARLHVAESRFRAVYEQSVMPIVMADLDGHILDANQAFRTLLAYGSESVVGIHLSDLLHPLDRVESWLSHDGLNGDEPPAAYCCTRRYLRRDGAVVMAHHTVSVMLDQAGQAEYLAIMVKDVTEEARQQEQIAWLAHHDPLTRLPNRYQLSDNVTQAVARGLRHGQRGAVVFIDLDRFKVINDTFGHAAGDRVLLEAARRMAQAIRTEDILARLGGDEFVLLVEDIPSPDCIARVSGKLVDLMRAPFLVDGEECFIGASLGIALYPEDGTESSELLRNADTAMYRAKESGRDGYCFYSPEMNARNKDRISLESALRHAIERDELEVHYQPKVSLLDGRVVGLEALLRWRHPERGLVSPGEFIPMLEESGLIVAAGDWVFTYVCAQILAWRMAGLQPPPVAVNVSARQFQEKGFAERVAVCLERHGLEGQMLELELTESLLMRDPEQAARVMQDLRGLGCHLAVDDFGTGYSSLAYLKRFPIDCLKIDASFVRDLPGDAGDAAIAHAIVGLARALDMKVVAEGVERLGQAWFLRAMGCHEMQGYLFSKPLPAPEMGRLLQSGQRLDLEIV